MISYHKFTLANGLRVIVHEDPETPLAVLNLLYDVGARDEDPQRTGFAHLFEHLMFEGSENVESYDEHVHRAGGESNAFTSWDMTNYFIMLPAENIETAFWLESDRMLALDIDQESLSVQIGVVSEEFKETHINQPYGDWMHLLRALSYTTHPYQWPVIGKDLSHIENATLPDVKAFFAKHYRPDRAILCVAGNVEQKQIKTLAEKWFGGIKPSPVPYLRKLPQEPEQTEARRQTVKANVPLDALYMGFKMCRRSDPDFHATSVIAELFSGGASGRMYQSLVQQKQLFSSVYGYQWDEFDEGLFQVQGHLRSGVSMDDAESAVWEELHKLQQEAISAEELQKIINKIEASIVFNEVNLRDRAFSLAYYELLGNIDEVNTEIEKYALVTPADVQRVAKYLFRPERCSTIHYFSDSDAEQKYGVREQEAAMEMDM